MGEFPYHLRMSLGALTLEDFAAKSSHFASHVNHRFDGERHARHYQHARTTFAEVFHIRFFVELDAAAMSAEVGYVHETYDL